MVMEIPDSRLVEQCLGGRKEAFETLVERHQQSVYNMAYRMIQNREEAKDLSQETFLRAYRKLRLFDARYSFRNWILTICANLGKNRLRSRRRRGETELVMEDLDGFPRDETGGKQRITDRLARVGEILSGLEAKVRTPLMLRYSEGLAYEEIAAVLGIGLSAAKMRVSRGRQEVALRLKLDSRGSEHEPDKQKT